MNVLAALRERLLRGAESPLGLEGDPARQRWPGLWQLLTARKGVEGKKKQPATVRIEAISQGFRGHLSDISLSVATSADSETLEGLWDALEAKVRDPKTDWRDLRHGERATAVRTLNNKQKADWEK